MSNIIELAKKHIKATDFYSQDILDFAAELQKDNLAKIAMLVRAINSRCVIGWIHGYDRTLYDAPTSGADLAAVTLDFDMVNSALSATKETRDAFIREIKAKAFKEAANLCGLHSDASACECQTTAVYCEEMLNREAEKRAK